MADENEPDALEKLRAVAQEDGRYSLEAYVFTFRGLDRTLHRLDRRKGPSHVTGKELLEGIRDLALEEFGYLARTVFESWGVRTTRDFGEIVFVMVNAGMMGKTERDRVEDFDGVFEFEEAFEKGFTVDWERVRKGK
jgi:uncharacterized repeat protein (TIGR04138 family)